MKRVAFIFLLFCTLVAYSAPKDTLAVHSPDGNISVKVWMNKQLAYKVFYKDRMIMNTSLIDLMQVNGKALSSQNRIISSRVDAVNTQIVIPVPERRKHMADHYNQLSISFKFIMKGLGIAFPPCLRTACTLKMKQPGSHLKILLKSIFH